MIDKPSSRTFFFGGGGPTVAFERRTNATVMDRRYKDKEHALLL